MVAESVFGVPATQALSVIAPRLPWAGMLTMAKVNWHPSGSLPERLTVAGVFWAVVLLVALAVGAVLGLTVRVAVAGLAMWGVGDGRRIRVRGAGDTGVVGDRAEAAVGRYVDDGEGQLTPLGVAAG